MNTRMCESSWVGGQCDRPSQSRFKEYCDGHRQQLNRGAPFTKLKERRKAPITSEEFYRNTTEQPAPYDLQKPCLLTGAGDDGHGYGSLYYKGKYVKAHRLSWVFANGREIKKGYDISHLCDVRNCVEPTHLKEDTRTVSYTHLTLPTKRIV